MLAMAEHVGVRWKRRLLNTCTREVHSETTGGKETGGT